MEAVISVDQENGWVYFTASPDQSRPYDIHLCRISLKGLNFKQQPERLGVREGTTGVSFPKRVFKIKGTELLPELYKKLAIQAIYGWKFKEIDVVSDMLTEAKKSFQVDKIIVNKMLEEFDENAK